MVVRKWGFGGRKSREIKENELKVEFLRQTRTLPSVFFGQGCAMNIVWRHDEVTEIGRYLSCLEVTFPKIDGRKRWSWTKMLWFLAQMIYGSHLIATGGNEEGGVLEFQVFGLVMKRR